MNPSAFRTEVFVENIAATVTVGVRKLLILRKPKASTAPVDGRLYLE